MEKTQNKNPLKAEALWYRSTCLDSLNTGASYSGKAPQTTGTPSKPRDIEHLSKVRDKWAQNVSKM